MKYKEEKKSSAVLIAKEFSSGKMSKKQLRLPLSYKQSKKVSEAHLFTDGASRGNPGEAGAGIVLQASTGEIIKKEAVYLGIQTNNVAEYQALLLGLKLAKKLGIRKL